MTLTQLKCLIINSQTKKPGWQRDLYRSNVNKFINHIKNGTFNQSLITVSNRNKKFVILDGQHKLEAIKETATSFKMDLCIYEDLTEEEEVDIYIMLNDVKRKFHREPDISTVEIFVGESIIASSVPSCCSCCIALVKLVIAVDK